MQLVDYLGRLEEKIDNLKANIAVIGLGYVGLPTAVAFHNAGFNVVGVDASPNVINSLKNGHSPITEEIGMEIPHGSRWDVTSEFENSIEKCDIAIVCVPTPEGDRGWSPRVSTLIFFVKLTPFSI